MCQAFVGEISSLYPQGSEEVGFVRRGDVRGGRARNADGQ